MAEFLLAYIPVIHRGYLDWFQRHPHATILVADSETLRVVDWLRKDIRAMQADEAARLLRGLLVQKVLIASPAYLAELKPERFFVADDEVGRALAVSYLTGKSVTFENVFLMRDSQSVTSQVPIVLDRQMSLTEMMALALDLATLSSNWWRRVGAVAFRDGRPLLTAFNHQLPSEYEPYLSGDSRTPFKKGIHIELTTDQHAEAAIVAAAARRGISLEDAELGVTTFPCLHCSKLVTEAGFKACYFRDEYSNRDAELILRSAGVELVQITP